VIGLKDVTFTIDPYGKTQVLGEEVYRNMSAKKTMGRDSSVTWAFRKGADLVIVRKGYPIGGLSQATGPIIQSP